MIIRRVVSTHLVVVAALAVSSSASVGQAALTHYTMEATVSFLIAGNLPTDLAEMKMGDRFQVDFDYDTGVADVEGRNFWGIYPDAAKNVTFSAPQYGISKLLGNGAFDVFNGSTHFQQDALRFDIPLNDGLGSTFIFWLRSNSTDGVTGPATLVDDKLPAVIDPTQWNFTNSIGFYKNLGSGGPSIFTGAMSVVAPEPATLVVAGAAFGALAVRRRRHASGAAR